MIEFSTSTMTLIRATITEIVGDFLPLIVVILGIEIGLWIVEKLLQKKE